MENGYQTHHQMKKSLFQVLTQFFSLNTKPKFFLGIAGKFPKSNNVNEFYDNLFNKNDMISENRWKIEHPEIPPRSGILPNIEEFDPGFFGLHYRQILTMSPSLRKMMEVATEAIIDAGIHPSELAGTKTGVFAGYCWNDGETDVLTRVSNRAQMFGITGYGIIKSEISSE